MSDHGADSDGMTVEDENSRNSETDDMHSILDNFMHAKEETLEELVGGFMYLTMDDVVRTASNTARALTLQSDPDVFWGGDADTALTSSVLNRGKAPGHSGVQVERKGGKRGGSGAEQSEDIEEEVLEGGLGSRRSGEDALFRHRPASLTKFDNFMLCEDDPESDCGHGEREDGAKNKAEGEEEEEEEGEEDWLPTSGYMASFAAGSASSGDSQTTEACPSERQTIHKKSLQPDTLCHTTSSRPEAAETTDLDPHCSDRAEESVTGSDSTETQCNDSSSSACNDDVEAPSWALNPGEAEEDISEAPVEQRVSVIQISARVVPPSEVAEGGGSAVLSQDSEKECIDEVVPFQLDDDYDYDNIVYTPKFTQAEMNYLSSFLPQKS
ncbi:hypothetical protein ACOMHN_001293 [Nucella lapillus]